MDAHSLRLGQKGVARLIKELPRLGGEKGLDAPVTLDLGPRVTLRLHGTADATAPEIELPDAEGTGVSCKLFTDRRYLLRALKLGFTEVKVRSPSHVVWCRDASRIYVWMPWSESPAPTAARTPPPSASASPEPQKETAVMVNAPSNGRHAGNGDAGNPAPPAASDPLAEAEAVRGLLAEAQSRLGRLIASLKLHRRQARAVQAAVASLRDLPTLSP